jgi:hypothetical protein
MAWIGLDDRENACPEGDGIPAQAAGIAAAVVALVVVEHHRGHVPQGGHRGEDVEADARVQLHHVALLGLEGTRLEQDPL